MMHKKTFFILLLFIILGASEMYAQCPMCKLGAETNLKGGGTAGAGLNTGILYMLAMPYMLVATLGIIWYKNRRKGDEELVLPS